MNKLRIGFFQRMYSSTARRSLSGGRLQGPQRVCSSIVPSTRPYIKRQSQLRPFLVPSRTITEEAKIDVHCHFIPDFYRKILEETGHEKVDGMPRIPVRVPFFTISLPLSFPFI